MMPAGVKFGYAQARAQACHGDRLSRAEWRLLDSSDGLAQFLHAASGTSLAARVQHFTTATSPHEIEGSLRRDWRAAVDNSSRWAPTEWRDSIAWTAWLPDLPAIAYLQSGGIALEWMLVDPVLSAFAVVRPDDRRRETDKSVFALAKKADSNESLIERWIVHWRTQWPSADSSSIEEFLLLLRKFQHAFEDPLLELQQTQDLKDDLKRQAVKLMRTRLGQPVVIFCHLLLTGLELIDLRGGLIRRALFNEVVFNEVVAEHSQ